MTDQADPIPAEPRERLTSSQVTEAVGASLTSLRNWERLGHIPTPARDRFGRRRYTPAEVDQIRAWLATHQAARRRDAQAQAIAGPRPNPPAPARPGALTTSQVAQLLDVSSWTLTQWERDGRIPPVPRNARGHRRYSHADVEQIRRWLAEREAARARDRERTR